ncbi:MAG: hypothetical protein JKY93_03110 [Gammaproteobacteria bacterium]|nr:hypothetical protein [Gammaproteobacteria bacterium]
MFTVFRLGVYGVLGLFGVKAVKEGSNAVKWGVLGFGMYLGGRFFKVIK